MTPSKKLTGHARSRERASAMVETVILMPLYLILVFALIFFGYSMLAKQKEAVASNYAILQPGRQPAAEVLPLFFPWNPQPATDLALLPDGSQATAGDATVRVHDRENVPDIYNPPWQGAPHATGVGDIFDAARVAEYLWVLAQPTYSQHFEWVNGEIVEVITTHENFKSHYLHRNGIVNRDAPPTQNKYTLGTTYAINCAPSSGWMDRREVQLEYLYTPPFFPHVYGGEPLTADQYLTMNYPNPTFTPNYQSGSRMMTRGEGQRSGTLDSDAQQVLQNMSALLNDGRTMPAPITDATLDAIKTSHWPSDADSLWVAK